MKMDGLARTELTKAEVFEKINAHLQGSNTKNLVDSIGRLCFPEDDALNGTLQRLKQNTSREFTEMLHELDQLYSNGLSKFYVAVSKRCPGAPLTAVVATMRAYPQYFPFVSTDPEVHEWYFPDTDGKNLHLTNTPKSPNRLDSNLPWTQRDRRNDVFLSFRGTEPLGARNGAPTDTVREQLVKPLAADLRRLRSVYFDETGLAEQRKAAPGAAIIDILQGILSTQGGGVAVLLISRTYFEREWPTLELAACVELHTARQVRLLPILLGEGVTPAWVKGQRFVQEVCSALSSVQMHMVPRGTADAMRAFIKERIQGALGDEGISGGSAEESFAALKITIAERLRGDADARDKLALALSNRTLRQGQTLLSVFDNVPNLSSKVIAPLRNALRKYFDTDEFRDLCDLVDRYEFKWHYLASDESAAVTDLGAVKARVDQWWAANPNRSRAGEGQ